MNLPVRQIIQSWQLLLLAVISIILSLASGWTTWAGMRNFTNESVLSLMITIGVQGVMLVLAWFIGMRVAEHAMDARPKTDEIVGGWISSALSKVLEAVVFLLLLATTLYLVATHLGGPNLLGSEVGRHSILNLMLISLAVSLALLVVVKFGIVILRSTLGVFRFVIFHITSVSMFALCVFISIFFSYDALFSIVLPDGERQRIAELRSKTDVSTIVASIHDANDNARSDELRTLLLGPAWKDYRGSLERVATTLKALPEKLRERIEGARKLADSQRQQKNKSLSELSANKEVEAQRREELQLSLKSRQQSEALLKEKITQLDKEIFQLDQKILEKEAEIDAEQRGIGVTSQRGRGPQFRRLTSQRAVLRKTQANLIARRSQYRQEAADGRRKTRTDRIAVAQLQSRLKQIDAEIDALKRVESEPQQGLTLSDIRKQTSGWQQKLSNAQLSFEQQPTREHLSTLHANCTNAQIYSAAQDSSNSTANRSVCEISQLQSAATRLFSLNLAKQRLNEQCTGLKAKASGNEVEERLSLARNCLLLSGLKPADARPISRSINTLERDRDDKAHRFVVTLNAFLDGNKLAFLAVAIASAMDILVLASGLLGAASIRSPLAKSGLRDDLTASEREVMIETALLPDTAVNARFVLGQFRPTMTAGIKTSGQLTYELQLKQAQDSRQVALLRRLLNAAIIIGAAQADQSRSDTFLINISLVEFLSKLARGADAKDDHRLEFTRLLTEALEPQPCERAKAVLPYFSHSLQYSNYSSRIDLSSVAPNDVETVRQCLNVASAFGYIAQAEDVDDSDEILASADVYLAILQLSSENSAEVDSDNQTVVEELPEQPDLKGTPDHQLPRVPTPQFMPSEPASPTAPTTVDTPETHTVSTETVAVSSPIADDRPTLSASAAHLNTASSDNDVMTSAVEQPKQDKQPDKPHKDQKPKVIISDGTFSFD